jgi:hypothetical protein
MKKILILMGGLVLLLVFAEMGISESEMGSMKEGNLTGEIVRISGEMMDVEDTEGEIYRIHVDPVGTQTTGDLEVGSSIVAEINEMGHANWIIVEKEEEEVEDLEFQ